MTATQPTQVTLIPALKPSEIFEELMVTMKARCAPILHGDPGIGKSQIVRQAADALYAEAYGYRIDRDYSLLENQGTKQKPSWQRVPHGFARPWFIDFRTALHDGVDLTGAPWVDHAHTKHITRWALPEFLPTDPRGGVFFFDEINRGSELTRNACFSLVLDGALGTYCMPEKWVCAAAVNDKDLGAAKMQAALNRRFAHFDMTADTDDSVAYAIRRDWNPTVIAFLKFSPALLNSFDPKERVSPNPRAWEFISNLLEEGAHPNPRIEQALFASVLGAAAAITFTAFVALSRGLPDIDEIFAKPLQARVPAAHEVGELYAVSSAIARRITPENLANAIRYVARLPKEFEIFAIKDGYERNKKLAECRAFQEWGSKNVGVL